MDTTPLHAAYRALLEAAATTTGAGVPTNPPPGEWTADQVMAHVAVVTATTIAAASLVAALPTLIVYFALQRHFIGGLTLGATKG